MNRSQQSERTPFKAPFGFTGRTSFLIACSVLAVTAVFTSCGKSGAVSKAEHQAIIEHRDSTINELVTQFLEIETTLDEIRVQEMLLSDSTNPEFERRGREAILMDIRDLGLTLEDKRNKIEQLEKDLEESGVQVSALKTKVRRLTAEVKKKQGEVVALQDTVTFQKTAIAQLNEGVDSLTLNLAHTSESLKMTSEERDSTVVVLQQTTDVLNTTTDELNTAFVAAGSARQLKSMGLLDKRFLGPTTLRNEFPDTAFTEIDIRQTAGIELASEKATLVTPHPADSYTVIPGEEGEATLQILNPDEFWKASKYLVVSVR